MQRGSIDLQTHSLLMQLLTQISLGQDNAMIPEIAKAVYPLIYRINRDKFEKSIKEQLHNFQKQLPKEFKIALNKIKPEYLYNKLHNLKDPKERKVLEKEKPLEVAKSVKELIEHPKAEKDRNINDPKVEKKAVKEEKVDIKSDSSKQVFEKQSGSEKEIAKRPLEKEVKQPLKNQDVKTLKEHKPFLKRSDKKGFKPLENQGKELKRSTQNRPITNKTIKNGHILEKDTVKNFDEKSINKNPEKNELKGDIRQNTSKQNILSKIENITKQLQKVLSTKALSISKPEQVAVDKPKISLTLPFVTFHPKKEKIKINTTKEDKFKLKRVEGIEEAGKDKEESQGNG